jgi:tetratricopeptide (TPR) repeat protein
MINKTRCFLMTAILFLFFVGTSLNSELVNAQNSHVDLIIQGASLIDHGMPNEAILIFDEILSKDPNNVSALMGKGMALKHLQKYEEARNFLDTVLELEPDNVYAIIERLYVLQYLKDHNEIRSSLVEILGPNLEKIEYFDDPNCFLCVGHVPFLYPMRDTDDYIGSVQFKMRDSNDNLVGVVESDLIYYPAHPVFDDSLSKYSVSRTLEKDGNIYEMKKFNIKYDVNMLKHDLFLNKLEVHLEQSGDAGRETIPFLAAWNFGIAVDLEGDYVVAEFEIGKKI